MEVEEENKEHKCEACLRNFEPEKSGWLLIARCPNFKGVKMDLSGKTKLKNLRLEDLRTANLADLKLPLNGLQTLTLLNVKTVNLADLKLPHNVLQRLWLINLKIANLEDLKLPRGLQRLWLDNLLKPVNVDEMLIANGYYDDDYLMQNEVENTTIEIQYENYKTYKRRCINLNWLFSEMRDWDWHLNIVIDNYCGFEI